MEQKERDTQQGMRGNKRRRKEHVDRYGRKISEDTRWPGEIELLLEAWLTKYTPTEEQEAQGPETKAEEDQQSQKRKEENQHKKNRSRSEGDKRADQKEARKYGKQAKKQK